MSNNYTGERPLTRTHNPNADLDWMIPFVLLSVFAWAFEPEQFLWRAVEWLDMLDVAGRL